MDAGRLLVNSYKRQLLLSHDSSPRKYTVAIAYGIKFIFYSFCGSLKSNEWIDATLDLFFYGVMLLSSSHSH